MEEGWSIPEIIRDIADTIAVENLTIQKYELKTKICHCCIRTMAEHSYTVAYTKTILVTVLRNSFIGCG